MRDLSFTVGQLRKQLLKSLVLCCFACGFVISQAESSDRTSKNRPKTNSKTKLHVQERVVAGSPEDFMEVRHLIIKGSNFDIGKKLAELAKDRHAVNLEQMKVKGQHSNLRVAALKLYFQRNYPEHLERMKGVAEVYGIAFKNNAYDFSDLPYARFKPACTCVFYPPAMTKNGKGILSRNFDFTTGTIQFQKPESNQVPVCSRPYLLELHPDSGYSSLSVCCYNLLGGVVDGINSEGLTVALLADDELRQMGKVDPAPWPQAGLGVVLVGRHLLEKCANVEEAKKELMASRLFYSGIPCHYIVADRFGNSFIWENSPAMHHGHIFEGKKDALITTNFMRQFHKDAKDLPDEKNRWGSFRRFQRIENRVKKENAKLSLDFIKSCCRNVAANIPATDDKTHRVGRTLWHALYCPEDRSVEIDFYLGEKPPGENGKNSGIRRSGYFKVSLSKR